MSKDERTGGAVGLSALAENVKWLCHSATGHDATDAFDRGPHATRRGITTESQSEYAPLWWKSWQNPQGVTKLRLAELPFEKPWVGSALALPGRSTSNPTLSVGNGRAVPPASSQASKTAHASASGMEPFPIARLIHDLYDRPSHGVKISGRSHTNDKHSNRKE